MNRSNWLRMCSGLVSLAAAVGVGQVASAQCNCGGGSSGGQVLYESIPMEDSMSPEALLREIDDPAKVINLSVVVNDKAIVFINGEPTETKGNLRPYIVRGLEPGKKYRFTIEGLVVTESGAEYFDKKEVVLTAGASEQVVLHVRRRNRILPPPQPVLPAPAAIPAG